MPDERMSGGADERRGLAAAQLLIRSSAHLLIGALRRALGMPDYAAYCAHLRERHPDRALPTEREFFDQFVRARYGDGPTRCC